MEPAVLRQVALCDEEALFSLTKRAHIGLTSLPKNQDKLKQAIANSVSSFSKKTLCRSALYWFVLEELHTHVIVGICGIHAQMEEGNPLHTFVLEEEKGDFLTKRPLLIPTRKVWSSSELCSLYLIPEARKKGWGKFLSYSRVLYIFLHPDLFHKEIAARYRGYFTKEGKSPFWEHIGKIFSGKEYEQFLEEAAKNPSLLHKFFPRHPIYMNLLPKSVQNLCSRVHPNTKGAVKLLSKIGFTPTGHSDFFDAGPFYSAAIKDISLFQKIRSLPPLFSSNPFSKTLLVVVKHTPFTVVQCKGEITNSHICMPLEVKKMLPLNSKTITAVRIS